MLRGRNSVRQSTRDAAYFPAAPSSSIIWSATPFSPMPPRRHDDIMDVDSGDSDASLDYDEPRRKGKGKAPKQKEKGKGKATEVSRNSG